MANSESKRLAVDVIARVDKLERGMERAARATDRGMGRVEGRTRKATREIETNMAKAGRSVSTAFAGISTRALSAGLAAVAGSLSVREIIAAGDAWTRTGNMLKAAGVEAAALAGKQEQLAEIAVRSNSDFEETTKLYSRLTNATREMGVSQTEVATVVETLNKSFALNGTTSAEAAGALTQFSQAMASGVLRGEELNSILEQAPPVARAIAKEFGVSVGKLKELGEAGALSGQRVLQAILNIAPETDAAFSQMQTTVGQALTNLSTRFTQFVGGLERTLGQSAALAALIDTLAAALEGMTPDAPANTLDVINERSELLRKELTELLKTTAHLSNGQLTVNTDSPAFKYAEERARQLRAEISALTAQVNNPNTRVKAAFDTVAATPLDTFTPVADRPKAPGSKKSGGKKQNDFEREVAQIRERSEAIRIETAAQAGLNPLVEDYGFAVNKASAAHSLLTAATQAGIKDTPALRSQIDQLATGYATASADADKLAESQDKVRQKAEEFQALGQDTLKGFITDLKEGKSGAEALAGALDKIADKLLDMSLTSLFDGIGKGGGGSIFGSIGKLFGFAEGGFTGHGGKHEPAGVVHKGEYVFSKAAVNKIGAGNLDAMHKRAKGYANGGLVSAPRMPALRSGSSAAQRAAPSVTVNADMRDSSAQAIAVLSQRIDRLQQELPNLVVQATSSALRNNPYALG